MSLVMAVLKALGFVLLTLPLMPVQWLLLKLHLPQARTFPHWYHRRACWILGLKIEVEGRIEKPGLIVANHTSWADIPVLSAVHHVSFVAKKEVGAWPLFGTLARLQRSVFVNREARQSTASSAQDMLARLKTGDTLVLFPEGTSHHGRWLKPFKTSFFAAVEASDIPLIPVSVTYHHQHGLPLTLRERNTIAWIGDDDLIPHLWGFLKGGPVAVKVTIHPALDPQHFAGRKELSAAAEKLIASTLHHKPAIPA